MHHAITAHGQTRNPASGHFLLHMWIVFLSYLNTFKAAFLQKIDKAKKVLFKIEVFHGNVLRRILEIRISEPKAMVYGELGRHKIKFSILNRTINFWKKLLNHPIRCHALFFVG